jgi:molybdopterin biosynthesis enzyme
MVVRPALDAMLGRAAERPVTAVLTSEVSVRQGTTHFVPVQLQPGQSYLEAVPLRDLLAVARAETGSLGMLVTPVDCRHLPPETQVQVLPL